MKNQKNYLKKLKALLTREEFNDFKKDVDSLIDFGCSYIEIKNYRKAFQIFSIGYRLIGDDLDIMNGIGVSLCELGRLKKSKSFLEKTLKFYPDDATTLANLAGVYWEEGNLGKAIFLYNKSLANDPDIVETHFNIINLYYEQGDLFMAYIAALNLLNIYPNNDQAKSMRNDIILDLGISIY